MFAAAPPGAYVPCMWSARARTDWYSKLASERSPCTSHAAVVPLSVPENRPAPSSPTSPSSPPAPSALPPERSRHHRASGAKLASVSTPALNDTRAGGVPGRPKAPTASKCPLVCSAKSVSIRTASRPSPSASPARTKVTPATCGLSSVTCTVPVVGASESAVGTRRSVANVPASTVGGDQSKCGARSTPSNQPSRRTLVSESCPPTTPVATTWPAGPARSADTSSAETGPATRTWPATAPCSGRPV